MLLLLLNELLPVVTKSSGELNQAVAQLCHMVPGYVLSVWFIG